LEQYLEFGNKSHHQYVIYKSKVQLTIVEHQMFIGA